MGLPSNKASGAAGHQIGLAVRPKREHNLCVKIGPNRAGGSRVSTGEGRNEEIDRS